MPGDTKYERNLARLRTVLVAVGLAAAAIAYFLKLS